MKVVDALEPIVDRESADESFAERRESHGPIETILRPRPFRPAWRFVEQGHAGKLPDHALQIDSMAGQRKHDPATNAIETDPMTGPAV